MNRQLLASLRLTGLLLLPATTLLAQSGIGAKKETTREETVVIKRDGDAKTVIEIKNGSVYVNGDPIITIHDADAGSVHKKIIIENGSGNSNGAENFEFPEMENDAAALPAARRAMLGVQTDAKDVKGGALVQKVTPLSPADKAGIKAGDRIIRLDGKAIADAKMLSMEVGAQHNAGDKVAVEYERDGQTKTTTATLASAPAAQQGNLRMFGGGGGNDFGGNNPNSFFREFHFPGMGEDALMDTRPKIGVSVEDRTDGAGVNVLSVTALSAAAKAGIKEGDVIMKLGGEAVTSVADLQDKIGRNKPGERLSIEYLRNGKHATAELVLPRAASKRDL